MKREITVIGFDNWMLNVVQSVHYLNNEKMDKAHKRLLKSEEPLLVNGLGLKIEENVINTTPKRKIFRSFTNPFKKQKISN